MVQIQVERSRLMFEDARMGSPISMTWVYCTCQPCKLCLRDVTSMVQIQVECSRLMFEDSGPGFGAWMGSPISMTWVTLQSMP